MLIICNLSSVSRDIETIARAMTTSTKVKALIRSLPAFVHPFSLFVLFSVFKIPAFYVGIVFRPAVLTILAERFQVVISALHARINVDVFVAPGI